MLLPLLTLQNIEIYCMDHSSKFTEPVLDVAGLHLRATAIPANTNTATDWAINIWNEWAENRVNSIADQDVSIAPMMTLLLKMSCADLAYWLGKFVLEVRKMMMTMMILFIP